MIVFSLEGKVRKVPVSKLSIEIEKDDRCTILHDLSHLWAMHRSVFDLNSVMMVLWILLSVSKSTAAVHSLTDPGQRLLASTRELDEQDLLQDDDLTVLDQRSSKRNQRALTNRLGRAGIVNEALSTGKYLSDLPCSIPHRRRQCLA